jgi:hypothetical protein
MNYKEIDKRYSTLAESTPYEKGSITVCSWTIAKELE